MKSSWLFLLIKVGLVLGLAWYVTQQVETRDRILTEKGNLASELVGRLEGNWQEADWIFHQEGESPLSFGDFPEKVELRPGFFTLLRGIRFEFYFFGIASWFCLLLIVTKRWQILLNAADVPLSYLRAFRLCFIGYFFNNVMPGLTGGDLVRAVMVARGAEEKKARAAVTVFVDRLIGLMGLLILGALVLSFAPPHFSGGEKPLSQVRFAAFGFLAFGFLGAWAYQSKNLRKFFRLDSLLQRLPFRDKIQSLDEALTLYRARRDSLAIALLLSILLQAFGVMAFWAMGVALGSTLSALDNFAVFPIVQTVSSIPISPAGWGIGETLYGRFFSGLGSTFTLGVAVSILFRLTTQVGFGLLGGLAWLSSRSSKKTKT
ncbi:MAG: lysylphosphatidylglycerol synthase transmembrane domain-containing protein [Planctomycetota bacterium]|nr:lysylphosphatidylglycerol synthase transmembrane domain-containing protein [Planctomycetota bacterium]